MNQRNRRKYGDVVRELRVTAGLSQVNLAERAGISQSVVSKIERAQTPDDAGAAGTLGKIAEALETTLEQIEFKWSGALVPDTESSPVDAEARDAAELSASAEAAISQSPPDAENPIGSGLGEVDTERSGLAKPSLNELDDADGERALPVAKRPEIQRAPPNPLPAVPRKRSHHELVEAMKRAIGKAFAPHLYSIDDIGTVMRCIGGITIDADDDYLVRIATIFLGSARRMRKNNVQETPQMFMVSVAIHAADRDAHASNQALTWEKDSYRLRQELAKAAALPDADALTAFRALNLKYNPPEVD